MKDKYQLVIIGAGPAGAYAALTAAIAGLHPLLVERDPEVGLPLACAEAISRQGLTGFINPDPRFIATEINAVAFTVSTGFSFKYTLPDCAGYVLRRPDFDSFLADQAVANGAELQTATWASDVIFSGTGPAVVLLESAEGNKRIEADYVIAADGVESMIGRKAGLMTQLAPAQVDTGLQYRISGISLDPHCLEFCVGKRYSPEGYLWVFPKSEHSANIGLGFCPRNNDNRQLRIRLDGFLRERYGQYSVEFEACGMIPRFTGLDILGRDNLLLVGDAARLIDSLTGAGISRAMHSGRLAAQTVINAVEGRVPRPALVETYRNAVDREMGHELRFLRKAHEVFVKFSDKDWEELARFLESYMAKQKAGSVDPAGLIKAALLGTPRLWRLARHLL
jgi:digeranylgeranylglycerophospholipid reductase